VAQAVIIASVLFAMLSGAPRVSRGDSTGVTPVAPLQWYRGNLHTHTNASDGDTSPEEVAAWYAKHGYHFLVITDHDKITLPDVSAPLLIAGEEVTDRLEKTPIHVNAIGLTKVVVPQGGKTALEVLRNDVSAVRAAGGLALVNHPNFGWAFTASELKQLEGATMMEIASGHPIVNTKGGGGVPSHEAMWDEVLTSGRTIWGAAVDDSHWWKCSDDFRNAPRPGQAWVVVRAASLTAPYIVDALRRGDFYSSTGVALSDVAADAKSLRVTIAENRNTKYSTEFIGHGGRVLATTASNPAVYAIRGDEKYVRARITDSNGRQAWTQPVQVPSR
jgi:hypothetical protein